MTKKPSSTTTVVPQTVAEHFARRLKARLDDGVRGVDHSVSERLRVAREQAIAHLATRPSTAVASQGNASVLSLSGPGGAWAKFGGLLPVVVLLVGLFCIDAFQDQYRAEELADVDVELLTADLPPGAYTDPGFFQFFRAAVKD